MSGQNSRRFFYFQAVYLLLSVQMSDLICLFWCLEHLDCFRQLMFCCFLTNYELKSRYCKYLIRLSRVCKFLKCCIVSSFFSQTIKWFPIHLCCFLLFFRSYWQFKYSIISLELADLRGPPSCSLVQGLGDKYKHVLPVKNVFLVLHK